jgi:hypothetical protein
LAEDDLQAFNNMTEAVKDIAKAIRDNKLTDIHPDLYKAIMRIVEFSQEALMAYLSHLVDHKAHAPTFLAWGTSTAPYGSGPTYY